MALIVDQKTGEPIRMYRGGYGTATTIEATAESMPMPRITVAETNGVVNVTTYGMSSDAVHELLAKAVALWSRN